MDSRDENSYDLQMFYRGSAPASTNGLIDDSKGSVGNDAQVQTRGMAPMQMKSGSTVTSSSDHKRPVRLALAVNFPVSGTFGLETGAMLTSLHSTFTTEAGRSTTSPAAIRSATWASNTWIGACSVLVCSFLGMVCSLIWSNDCFL